MKLGKQKANGRKVAIIAGKPRNSITKTNHLTHLAYIYLSLTCNDDIPTQLIIRLPAPGTTHSHRTNSLSSTIESHSTLRICYADEHLRPESGASDVDQQGEGLSGLLPKAGLEKRLALWWRILRRDGEGSGAGAW